MGNNKLVENEQEQALFNMLTIGETVKIIGGPAEGQLGKITSLYSGDKRVRLQILDKPNISFYNISVSIKHIQRMS